MGFHRVLIHFANTKAAAYCDRMKRVTAIALAYFKVASLIAQQPGILQEPESIMAQVGQPVRIACSVTGAAPVFLSWQKDDADLPDRTNSMLVISNAQLTDSGNYRLVATNVNGFVLSQPASVLVTTNPRCFMPPLWQKRLRATQNPADSSQVYAMATDTNGNVFVTGPDATQEGEHYLTAKLDASGHEIWRAIFFGGQAAYATTLKIDANGNTYVSGYLSNTDKPTGWDNDYLTIKYDTNGSAVWTNHWDSDPTKASWDMPYSLALDDNGASYVLGTSGTIKLSADGERVWTNTVCQGDQVQNLERNGGHLYARVGKTAAWASIIYKLNTTNGEIVWSKPAESLQNFVDLVCDQAGNIYTLASSNYLWAAPTGAIVAQKFDETGGNIWTAYYDGPYHNMAMPNRLCLTSDGSVYVAGATWNTNRLSGGVYDNNPMDLLILKLKADGNLAWAATYRTEVDIAESGIGIVANPGGDIYVIGSTSKGSPQGSTNTALLLKYDQNGNLLWDSQIADGVPYTLFNNLALGNRGQIFAAGLASYRLAGLSHTEFFVAGYDDLNPRLHVGRTFNPLTREVCFVGPRWTQFDLLATTNLASPDWQSIGIITNYNGLMPFFDTQAGQFSTRFYRASQQEP